MKEEKKLISLEEFMKLSDSEQTQMVADAILGKESQINWEPESKELKVEKTTEQKYIDAVDAVLYDMSMHEKITHETKKLLLAAKYAATPLVKASSLPSKEVQQSDAGWISVEDLRAIRHHVKNLVQFDKDGHLGCNGTEWALSELDILVSKLNLPAPPKQ